MRSVAPPAKRMRKIVLLLAVLVGCLILTGCNGSQTPQPDVAATKKGKILGPNEPTKDVQIHIDR